MRSPNYPAIGLKDAIAEVQKLWKAEKKTVVSGDVAAKALGYKGLSGPPRVKLAALKKFGLVDDGPQGMAVSDSAVRILHQPEDSEDRLKALRDAALRPGLFKELLKTHASAGSL